MCSENIAYHNKTICVQRTSSIPWVYPENWWARVREGWGYILSGVFDATSMDTFYTATCTQLSVISTCVIRLNSPPHGKSALQIIPPNIDYGRTMAKITKWDIPFFIIFNFLLNLFLPNVNCHSELTLLTLYSFFLKYINNV